MKSGVDKAQAASVQATVAVFVCRLAFGLEPARKEGFFDVALPKRQVRLMLARCAWRIVSFVRVLKVSCC